MNSVSELNDEALVRRTLVDSIQRSGKSREVIAEELTSLVGRKVTARMIMAFTAESKELHRWPAEWDRAFCQVVGDQSLLVCRVQAAGLKVISPSEYIMLQLGRACMRRARAQSEIDRLLQGLLGRSKR